MFMDRKLNLVKMWKLLSNNTTCNMQYTNEDSQTPKIHTVQTHLSNLSEKVLL
jgi:hypothetical protein